MGLTGMFGLNGPRAIIALFGFEEIEGVLKAEVIGMIGFLEIIQSAENIVAPAGGMGEHGEGFVDDVSGAVGFV